MKIAVIFLLMQLVCFSSMGKTIADEQPCLADIHAVLRQLSVSLAQQQERMKNLQRENQDHAAKLRELQGQKTEVQRLKQQLQDHAAKLRELQGQKPEDQRLNQQLQVKQVAFSAYLSPGGRVDRGPFNKFETLVFKGVVTNIGNAYNPNTGVFTAPVRGAYHFEWHLAVERNHVSGAVLVKNSDRTFLAYSDQTAKVGTSSNGGTLLLQAGDAVLLHLWAGTKVFDNDSHHTSFSGHLIFTM